MRRVSRRRHCRPLAAVQAVTPPAAQQLRLQQHVRAGRGPWERERKESARSAVGPRAAPPCAPAHRRGPSEPGGSGSRAGNSVPGEAGTPAAARRSGSPARAAAAAPGPPRRPGKRSRAARGAPPAPRAAARAAARASWSGRGAGGRSCWGCGMGRLGPWAGFRTLGAKPLSPDLGSISRRGCCIPRLSTVHSDPRARIELTPTPLLAPDRPGPHFVSWILHLPRGTPPPALQTEVPRNPPLRTGAR